jgi:phosphate starvation-inducible PhoH-like protein
MKKQKVLKATGEVATLEKPHVEKFTPAQEDAIRMFRDNDITFLIGPARTGKTHVAFYCALSEITALIKTKPFSKIVVTRPVLEAGRQRMGFIPGDLSQKLDPFIRPIYDVASTMYHSPDKVIKDHVIFEPISHLRGRTLSNAIVIIDEAQNCIESELQMVLTRFGKHTKFIVTGDPDQSDLWPEDRFLDILIDEWIKPKIPGIAVKQFTKKDISINKMVETVLNKWPANHRS